MWERHGCAILIDTHTSTATLQDCMPQFNEACKDDDRPDSCGSVVAVPYFLTYIIITTIILINLFTAVIIETFEKTHNQVGVGFVFQGWEWHVSPQAGVLVRRGRG